MKGTRKMKPEIKQRIEQIKAGQVPDVYKKTKIGVVPLEWGIRQGGQIFAERNECHNANLQLLSITAEKGIIPRSDIDGKDTSSADKSKYKKICVGDIGYNTMRMWQGVSAFSSYEGIVSPAYTILSPMKYVNAKYYSYLFKLQNVINVFYRNSQGLVDDTRSLKYDWFKIIDMPYPPLAEQEKIVKILSTQDRIIELYQRKIEELQKMKKIYLSKMFPKKGENVPEWRFSQFNDSWEQRKLGDIADIVGGGIPSTGNQSYWDGDIDWYAPAEIADQIYANSSQKKITGLGYENSSAKMLPPGTVLFTSRAGIGKTAILTRKGCTNQGFQSIVPHRGELDSYFIFSRTEELKRYGELVGAGSTFVEVSGKQMAVMELMMPPTMREQQTIGGFFQQLDHLITLHQRKLEETKKYKKALMQLLLTGIVRCK